jgi:hypothetical protein
MPREAHFRKLHVENALAFIPRGDYQMLCCQVVRQREPGSPGAAYRNIIIFQPANLIQLRMLCFIQRAKPSANPPRRPAVPSAPGCAADSAVRNAGLAPLLQPGISVGKTHCAVKSVIAICRQSVLAEAQTPAAE